MSSCRTENADSFGCSILFNKLVMVWCFDWQIIYSIQYYDYAFYLTTIISSIQYLISCFCGSTLWQWKLQNWFCHFYEMKLKRKHELLANNIFFDVIIISISLDMVSSSEHIYKWETKIHSILIEFIFAVITFWFKCKLIIKWMVIIHMIKNACEQISE